MRAAAEAVVMVVVDIEGSAFSRRGTGSSPSIAGPSAPAGRAGRSPGRAACGRAARPGSRRAAPSPFLQPASLAFTSGAGPSPCRAPPRAGACSAAITLPMSLIARRRRSPRSPSATACCIACVVHLPRQERLDDVDLGVFLGDEVRAVALPVQVHRFAAGFHHAAQHGEHVFVRDLVDPLGRAAMSVSFSRARIMRRVEIRAASPAFIEALSWSVNWSLNSSDRTPSVHGFYNEGAARRSAG